MPRLETQGSTRRLVVDGKPMLVLGGELGNSSASSQAYMARYWPKLKAMNLNTVLAPVSWELIEPKEGVYDFSSVDGLLKDARAQDMHLVLLWFGAWKNSMSTYVPSWVKRDDVRFPRAKAANGVSQEILSAFSANTRDADARAYAALLAHLKAVDAQGTVLMVQVENEIGMLPVAREWGAEANAAWAAPVPAELLKRLASGGDRDRARTARPVAGPWREDLRDLGPGVRRRRRRPGGVHRLVLRPLRRRRDPGRQGRLSAADVRQCRPEPHGQGAGRISQRRAAAAPDRRLEDRRAQRRPDLAGHLFPQLQRPGRPLQAPDNALFIPEANNVGAPETPANAFYAIGKLDAFGFSPFQVENADAPAQEALTQAYGVLRQLTPAILSAQGLDKMSGFKPRVLEDGTVLDQPVSQVIGDYRFNVAFIDTWTPKADQKTAGHGGVIIQIGPEEYLMAGRGLVITFAGDRGRPRPGRHRQRRRGRVRRPGPLDPRPRPERRPDPPGPPHPTAARPVPDPAGEALPLPLTDPAANHNNGPPLPGEARRET
jgi:hypothetical protein